MSDTHALPPRGHNLPPIIAPTDAEMLADLQNRFPELPKELAEFEEALATYPTEFALEDEDRAAALQDLLGKMKKHKSVLAAHKKTEKKPWDGLVKVVQNFFTKADEAIDGLLETWAPRHQAFLDLKKAEASRKAEEAAQQQREREETARREAEAAEARAEAARQAEAQARQREEEARQRAEEEERKAKLARERAEAAAAEEKRIAREKADRERAEREVNDTSLKAIRRHMKDVDKLNTLSEADEASEAEIAQLDALVRPGGIVSVLAGPVASSHLLDDDQREEVQALSVKLTLLRKALAERFDAKERRRRAKEAKEAAERDAAAAAERARLREQEEARATAARAERERLDREALDAKDRQKAAQGDVREARAEQRGAVADQKDAAKTQKASTADAERAANRADRIESRLENSTDADLSRTRGDLGSTGALVRRWVHVVTDEAALRAVSGPLGEHFTEDALSGAAYRWMRAHQAGFTGERVEGRLPGVVFVYEQGARIA